jgi:hypothetical protein
MRAFLGSRCAKNLLKQDKQCFAQIIYEWKLMNAKNVLATLIYWKKILNDINSFYEEMP